MTKLNLKTVQLLILKALAPKWKHDKWTINYQNTKRLVLILMIFLWKPLWASLALLLLTGVSIGVSLCFQVITLLSALVSFTTVVIWKAGCLPWDYWHWNFTQQHIKLFKRVHLYFESCELDVYGIVVERPASHFLLEWEPSACGMQKKLWQQYKLLRHSKLSQCHWILEYTCNVAAYSLQESMANVDSWLG